MSNLPQGELCSVYSFAQGEDPIGSATPFSRCLLVEIPTPWDRDVWSTSDKTKAIKRLAGQASRHGDVVRLLAFQPDPNADRALANMSRVFVYQRPEAANGVGGFSAYAKREYLVPSDDLLTVLPVLLQEPVPAPLPAGVQEVGRKTRDIFLCTHVDRDVCCGRFGKELFDALQASDQVRSQSDLRLWRVSHLGGHRLAPTLMDMPNGMAFGHLTADTALSLLEGSGDLEALLRCYRGWSGMEPMAQIAERAVWRETGWRWTSYRRQASVLVRNEDKSGTVRIDWTAPNGGSSGNWEVTIEYRDQVHTLNNSFTEKYFYIDRFKVASIVPIQSSNGI